MAYSGHVSVKIFVKTQIKTVVSIIQDIKIMISHQRYLTESTGISQIAMLDIMERKKKRKTVWKIKLTCPATAIILETLSSYLV